MRVRRFVVAAAIVLMPFASIAQVIPPSEQPGRERERFIEPSPPRAQPGGAAISLPSTLAPPGASEVKIIVREVKVVGTTVYSSEQLASLYADMVGHEVTLQHIYDLAQRITAKYGADGYVLSRAIVPPQQIDPRRAVIRIQVIEGWINKVEWPDKLSRYRDFFSSYAAKIVGERPANIRTMERYLLLAGDLPGLKISTSLKPSPSETGAATLVVEVAEKAVDASSRVDNRGTLARGPNQFLVTPSFNNIFGGHEAFSIAYAGASPLRELQYVAPSYRQVLTSEGVTAFVNGSYSWGLPGTVALKLLEFKTKSTVVEAGMSYPVIRARERNLTLSGLSFMSDSHSDILSEPFNEDRLRGLRLKADADVADSLGGINQFNFTFSQGFKGLGSSENGNPLASRAAGRVDFAKVEGYAGRLQPLFASFAVQLSAYGQYAFTPLLSPEQCGYGGSRFGRAFDPSQLIGDRCWQVSGELQYTPPIPEFWFSTQLYGFIDYGKLYTLEPATGTAPTSEGASVGGGVRVGWQNYLSADLSAAKAIEGPRNDWRFFFAVAARY